MSKDQRLTLYKWKEKINKGKWKIINSYIFFNVITTLGHGTTMGHAQGQEKYGTDAEMGGIKYDRKV